MLGKPPATRLSGVLSAREVHIAGSSLFPVEQVLTFVVIRRVRPGAHPLPFSRVWATRPNRVGRPKQPSLWRPIPPTRHPTSPRPPPHPPRSTSNARLEISLFSLRENKWRSWRQIG